VETGSGITPISTASKADSESIDKAGRSPTRISQQKMIDGAVGFLLAEVVPKTTQGTPLRIAARAAATYFKKNAPLQEKILRGPVIEGLLGYDSGADTWEPDGYLSQLETETRENGGRFCVTIPLSKFPLLSISLGNPGDIEIIFTADDISTLRRYLTTDA
jgi:hypothetical protein